jgi:hypothetical protein
MQASYFTNIYTNRLANNQRYNEDIFIYECGFPPSVFVNFIERNQLGGSPLDYMMAYNFLRRYQHKYEFANTWKMSPTKAFDIVWSTLWRIYSRANEVRLIKRFCCPSSS